MRRLFFRTVGIWLMAGALIAAVIDGAKSIAASAVVLTPLADTLVLLSGTEGPYGVDPQSLSAFWPLDVALAWVLAAPSAAILAALGVLCLLAGPAPASIRLSREFAT
jgi:hypothetical protein